MARLTSGRVKKTPQSGITSDRYQFLGLDQAEPDLGDPLVGPSSIAAKPAPPGTRYIPVAVDGQTGERYWLDAQQFFGASTPGAITVFDEATQVGAANSTYIVQFVGEGVSVDAVGTAISEQTGIATVRITKTPEYWKESTLGIHTLSNVGVGTTNPTSKLSVTGTLNVTGVSTFGSNISIGGSIGFTTSNVRIGQEVGSGGADNNFIGREAGKYNTTGFQNNFFGANAGLANTSGFNNNFFGIFAGFENTSGKSNNFIGALAGYYNTTGGYNNFFGESSGYANSTGSSNNFIGRQAGYCNTSGGFNNFFGRSSGFLNTTGCNNNFFGQCAGYQNSSGCDNNFFGNYVGQNNSSGSRNIFIGSCAGRFNSTGSENTFFGSFAGCNNTSGSYNIVIGSGRTSTPILNGSNQLVIGAGSTDWIVGNSSYNVGIGTTNPTSKLTVQGNTSLETLTVGTGGTIFTATLDSGGSLVGVGTTNPEIARSYVLSGNAFVVDGNIIQGSVGLATFATLRAKTATIYGVTQTYGVTKAEGGAEFGSISFNKGRLSISTEGNLDSVGVATFVGLNVGTGGTVITTTSNGRIGIGTTNPQAKVHIVGSGSTALLVDGDVRVVGILTVGSSSITFDGVNNTVSIGTVRLADEGGNANYTGVITASSFVGDGSGLTNLPGGSQWITTSAGIHTLGKVGIGTTRPTSDLHVVGDVRVAGILSIGQGTVTIDGDTQQIALGENVVIDSVTGLTVNGDVILNQPIIWNPTDVGIHTLGKVGIGTTNPTTQLEVNGTIKVKNGDVEIPNGYALVINGQNVVTVNSLGAQITSSSLTTVGTLERLNIGGNLNVTGISTFTSIDISNSTTNSISTSFSSTSTEVLHAGISTSSYRSVEYMVQATEGSRFQAIKVLAIHDGTTAYKTEYGNIYNNGSIASFDVDVSGGNLRLVATASTSSSVTYKVHYTTIKS